MASEIVETVTARVGERDAQTARWISKQLGPGDRVRRGLIGFGGCMLGAVLSVPIIGAHWVLVPGFLLAGPVVAFWRYRQAQLSDRVEFRCSACGNAVAVPLDPKQRPPAYLYCPQCKVSVHVEQ